jgi:peptidoglycan hydrolase-like protein with peptidoglycan-binding domain
VVALVVLGLVGAAGFWAGRQVLVPPANPLDEGLVPVTYVVAEGRVGRSLRFVAVAEWVLAPLARNAAAGTVTTVDVASGEEVVSGQRLYSVDLRPVLIAQGEVPMFRELSLNGRGPDVAQLQTLLAGLGFYQGEVDGVFRTGTRTAVRAWQESLGVTVDGVVRRGDLIFVPGLPVRVALASELLVGAILSGGEPLVLSVPSDPLFRVPLSVEQRTVVPLSAPVLVTFPEGVWEGRVDRAVENPQSGQLDLILTTADGGPLCGDECARWVELDRPTDFGVEIVVIPETVGPAVPVAAIGIDAGNQPYVTAASGERIDIGIVESSQGIAVVEGVEIGTVLLLAITPPPEGSG